MTSHTGQSSPSWIPIWEKGRLDQGAVRRCDDGLRSLRFRRPRSGTPLRLQRAGLSAGLEESSLKHDGAVDHWEVLGQKCIRHHTAPRLMTFDIHQPHDCPIPLMQLQPQCTVEAISLKMELPRLCPTTGNQTDRFNRCDRCGLVRQFSRSRIHQNTATGLLSLAARRRLRSAVRNNIQVRLVEKKIMSQAGTTNSRRVQARMDILETFAGEANISSRAPSFGLRAMQPVDYRTGFDLAKSK